MRTNGDSELVLQGAHLADLLAAWHRHAEETAGWLHDGIHVLDEAIDEIDQAVDQIFMRWDATLSVGQRIDLRDLGDRRKLLDDQRADLVKAARRLDAMRDALMVDEVAQ